MPSRQTDRNHIAAVVAAAGLSRRMGKPKQLLPWGETTVLNTVVDNLEIAGATPIICVLGHLAGRIRETLQGTSAVCVENLDYRQGEMLSSYQTGIRHLCEREDARPYSSPPISGALLVLSDQPHIPPAIIRTVIDHALRNPDAIIIPSYDMRRGHPICLPRRLWAQLIDLPQDSTLRTLIRTHNKDIHYVNVDSRTILQDMDTLADYSARLDESGLTDE